MKTFDLPKTNLMVVCLLINLTFAAQNEAQEKVPWKNVLDQPDGWYESKEAISLGEHILLHQKNNGGWYKNIDTAVPLRDAKKNQVREEKSFFKGNTIDNNAGFIQAEFLSKVYQETGDHRFGQAVLKALDYMMDAQFDKGGWPQYFPIRNGYDDGKKE